MIPDWQTHAFRGVVLCYIAIELGPGLFLILSAFCSLLAAVWKLTEPKPEEKNPPA